MNPRCLGLVTKYVRDVRAVSRIVTPALLTLTRIAIRCTFRELPLAALIMLNSRAIYRRATWRGHPCDRSWARSRVRAARRRELAPATHLGAIDRGPPGSASTISAAAVSQPYCWTANPIGQERQTSQARLGSRLGRRLGRSARHARSARRRRSFRLGRSWGRSSRSGLAWRRL
jgi:hypothetical protein